jgi:WD40 repeat protein
VTSQQEIGTPVMVGPGQSLGALAFSPDGATLAVAGHGSIRLWDVATQQEIGAPMTAGAGCGTWPSRLGC